MSISDARASRLPSVGVLTGLWAALPPYSGPPLEAAAGAEVVDHVVAAAVLLAVSVAALVLVRRLRNPGTTMLACGLVVLLSGLWMTGTHLPVVRQATTGQAPWDAVAYHVAPGLAALVLGVVWVVRSRSHAELVSPG